MKNINKMSVLLLGFLFAAANTGHAGGGGGGNASKPNPVTESEAAEEDELQNEANQDSLQNTKDNNEIQLSFHPDDIENNQKQMDNNDDINVAQVIKQLGLSNIVGDEDIAYLQETVDRRKNGITVSEALQNFLKEKIERYNVTNKIGSLGTASGHVNNEDNHIPMKDLSPEEAHLNRQQRSIGKISTKIGKEAFNQLLEPITRLIQASTNEEGYYYNFYNELPEELYTAERLNKLSDMLKNPKNNQTIRQLINTYQVLSKIENEYFIKRNNPEFNAMSAEEREKVLPDIALDYTAKLSPLYRSGDIQQLLSFHQQDAIRRVEDEKIAKEENKQIAKEENEETKENE